MEIALCHCKYTYHRIHLDKQIPQSELQPLHSFRLLEQTVAVAPHKLLRTPNVAFIWLAITTHRVHQLC